MLRKLLFSLLFIFAGHFAFAQDTLYRINREKIAARILEINPTQVKYKATAFPNGPTYVVNKKDVEKIVFSDGHVEYFKEIEDNAVNTNLHPVEVSLNSFDLMFGMISVTGEYYFPKCGVSIKVPVSIGLEGVKGSANEYSGDFFYYNKKKIISAGAGLMYYPGHMKHTLNYYTGFSFEYGRMISRDYFYDGYPYYESTQRVNHYWLGTGVVNGVLIKLSDRVNIGMSATLGMLVENSAYEYNSVLHKNTHYYPLGRMEISLGFRFGKVKQKGSDVTTTP